MTRVFAWAAGVTSDEAPTLTNRIPGLGLILYAPAYAAARHLRTRPIAYVNNLANARLVAEDPTAWEAAILGDERNVTGLSGAREEPAVYMARLEPARLLLENAGVRTSSAGLGMLGGFFGHFDHEYTTALRGWTHQAGVNLAPPQYASASRGIRQHPDTRFFVTLIPQRASWTPHNTILAATYHRYLVTPSLLTQFRTLLRDPQVAGVGVWCLRELLMRDGTYQAHHGLIDRHGRMTWQGDLVRRALEGAS